MGSLPTIKLQALDANGDPVPGGKLNFFEDGTSTPLDTFSDEALTSANTNPVVADSSGRFGEIYLKTDEAYKIQLTDASDVEIWQVDNINASNLTSTASVVRVKQIASNPLDFGALGDGVADESAAVQSAIDGATKVVDLLGKTFRCDSAITVPSGIIIQNGKLDFQNSADNEYIRLTGTAGTEVGITANANQGDTAITVASASGLVVGDQLFIETDTGDFDGEIVTIKSIAGLVLTLVQHLEGEYLTATTPTYRKITPVKDASLHNLEIVANKAAAGTGNIIDADFTERFKVRDCVITGIKTAGILIEHSLGVDIENTFFDDGAGFSLGVNIQNAVSEVSIRNCKFARLQMAVRQSGESMCSWIQVLDCKFEDCKYGGFFFRGSNHVRVMDCDFFGPSASAGVESFVDAECFDIEIIGNRIIAPNGRGVFLHNNRATATVNNGQPWFATVRGNTIQDAGGKGIEVTPGANGLPEGIEITENRIIDCGDDGISVVLGAAVTMDYLSVNRNFVYDSGATSINVESNHASAIIRRVSIAGNIVRNASGSWTGISALETLGTLEFVQILDNEIHGTDAITKAIEILGSNQATISRNHIQSDTISGTAVDAIHATSVTDLKIIDNVITGKWDNTGTSHGVFAKDCFPLDIDGNKIEDSGGAASRFTFGIYVETTAAAVGIRVCGNNIINVDRGIHFEGTAAMTGVIVNNNRVHIEGIVTTTGVIHLKGIVSRGTIVGNYLETTTASPDVIRLEGAAAGNISNITISGNILDGDVGIQALNSTQILNDSNIFLNFTSRTAGAGINTFDFL